MPCRRVSPQKRPSAWLRPRAPARRREPCICQRQIRKAEPRGIIGAEPLGMEGHRALQRCISTKRVLSKLRTSRTSATAGAVYLTMK